MGTLKQRYVRLSALDQWALWLAFIDTTERKISEEHPAQCFSVVRLTVRNTTIGQGLNRGLLDIQRNRLRRLYEAVVGATRLGRVAVSQGATSWNGRAAA